MRRLLLFIGLQQPPSGVRHCDWIKLAVPPVTAWAGSKATAAASNPNEGCQFVGRAFGERSSQMVEKGGNPGVQ